MVLRSDRPEAQRIHNRHRPRAHGENVAQNSAHARGRTLERLNERRMIVRFDLEGAGPTLADVDDAGVLAWSLQHMAAVRGQSSQMNARRLVRAVLAPHHAENAEFGERRFASAQEFLDLFVFIQSEAVIPNELGRDGWSLQRGHRGLALLLSHFEAWEDREKSRGELCG